MRSIVRLTDEMVYGKYEEIRTAPSGDAARAMLESVSPGMLARLSDLTHGPESGRGAMRRHVLIDMGWER